jgi:hypothetical protein
MPDKSKSIEYTEEEIARRRDALAKHMLGTPPRPLKESLSRSPDKRHKVEKAVKPS